MAVLSKEEVGCVIDMDDGVRSNGERSAQKRGQQYSSEKIEPLLAGVMVLRAD
jgi:hypothetical protein